MRRMIAALAIVMVLCTGCVTIPDAIKIEISFADTVVDAAICEVMESTSPEQRAVIGTRALRRLAPHTENLRRWAEQGGAR